MISPAFRLKWGIDVDKFHSERGQQRGDGLRPPHPQSPLRQFGGNMMVA